MDWTSLGEPRPHDSPSAYLPMKWPEGQRRGLPPAEHPLPTDFGILLQSRRTQRDFSSEMSESQLSQLLSLVCQVQATMKSDYGFDLQQRGAPSAGAIHGIHLLFRPPGGPLWQRYDPLSHELVDLPDSERSCSSALQEASKLMPMGNATLVLLAAEPAMYAAKYANHESLVWRDAGVLLGYLSLTATALGLIFCPLGLTGEVALKALDSQGKLAGVGMAAVASA